VDILTQFVNALVSLSREMAPFLLLGFIVAGILHVYVPAGAFNKWFGKKNLKSVVYAALMGIPLPLCSCGVIPTGISIYKEGASKGATVSFLISTPQTGVDSIMVTYSLLGFPFALARPFIALITGVFGGWLVNKTDDEESSIRKKGQANEDIATSDKEGNKFTRIWSYAFDEFLGDIADWLVIGLLLAGVISVLIPEEFFESVYLKNEFISMFIVLVASIPFYVCATGSVPIAAALLMKGLNPGAVLVFLMAGPATNMATMTVISKTLGKKTLIIYISSLVLGSMVFGLMINHLFPSGFFTVISTSVGHHSGNMWVWVEWISVVFLCLILIRFYLMKFMNYLRKKKGEKSVSSQSMTIGVTGMTCENCAARVEASLMQLENINESKANLKDGTVEIKGNNIELEKLKTSVEKVGYGFTDIVE
jgi:uncharacterized membrane protein YraQ (UPF0718 family)/copper chaperone CopZ